MYCTITSWIIILQLNENTVKSWKKKLFLFPNFVKVNLKVNKVLFLQRIRENAVLKKFDLFENLLEMSYFFKF